MGKRRATKSSILKQDNKTAPKSQRLRSLPKKNYLAMGQGQNLYLQGIPQDEEVYARKRTRKNHRYDDSEYQEFGGRRPSKKVHLINKVQALLNWKSNQHGLQQPRLNQYQIHKVKSVSTQNLEKYGKNLEAIFININWDDKGQKMDDFKKLKIQSSALMKKGMLFVWAPKEKLADIVYILQKKHFIYVQNFEIINLDRRKAVNIVKKTTSEQENVSCQTSKLSKLSKKSKKDEKKEVKQPVIEDFQLIPKLLLVDPRDLIAKQQTNKQLYLNQSKKTLFLFRRESNQKLELRHQRTCDVVFDMPIKSSSKNIGQTRNYIFNMIETLLPKGMQQENIQNGNFRMMQLWGQSQQPRRGWIHINQ